MTACERCSTPLRVAPERNDGARMLRLSKSPQGHCVNCAVAEFLWVSGSRAIVADPSAFRLPHVQTQFAAVMRAGMADARPEEVDWEHVITHWDLPFRVGKKFVDPVENPHPRGRR